jgi:UDP-2,3-diacylglucosamine hydrolase
MYSLFISDLHLAENQPRLLDKFDWFTQHWVARADALYILGDLFDYWIGDDAASEFQRQIAQRLHTISQTTPVYLMVGNRDFLLGEQFAHQADCQLLNDPYVLHLYGHRVLLKHGDDLCGNDRLHLAFRKVSRQSWAKRLFLLLPIQLRQAIARRIRQRSASRQRYLSASITDTTDAQVRQAMQEQKVRHLIHGHTHQPTIELMAPATANWQSRIVLSDWGNQGNALVAYADGAYRLIYF